MSESPTGLLLDVSRVCKKRTHAFAPQSSRGVHVNSPASPARAERVRLITCVAATMNRTALFTKEVRLDRLPWSERPCKGSTKQSWGWMGSDGSL